MFYRTVLRYFNLITFQLPLLIFKLPQYLPQSIVREIRNEFQQPVDVCQSSRYVPRLPERITRIMITKFSSVDNLRPYQSAYSLVSLNIQQFLIQSDALSQHPHHSSRKLQHSQILKPLSNTKLPRVIFHANAPFFSCLPYLNENNQEFNLSMMSHSQLSLSLSICANLYNMVTHIFLISRHNQQQL